MGGVVIVCDFVLTLLFVKRTGVLSLGRLCRVLLGVRLFLSILRHKTCFPSSP